MAEIVWKKVGTLKVTREWKFTTFLYGDFFRVSTNSDNDRFYLGFFNYPKKDSLISSRTIKIFDKAVVYPVPETPFSQVCIGVKYSLDINGLIVTIEIGTDPDKSDKDLTVTIPRGSGRIKNVPLANQLPNGLDDFIG